MIADDDTTTTPMWVVYLDLHVEDSTGRSQNALRVPYSRWAGITLTHDRHFGECRVLDQKPEVPEAMTAQRLLVFPSFLSSFLVLGTHLFTRRISATPIALPSKGHHLCPHSLSPRRRGFPIIITRRCSSRNNNISKSSHLATRARLRPE